MSHKDYNKLVDAKSKLKENSTCIDCGLNNPKWASIRYGTFFCLECAAIHRSLGVYLDFVMSVNLNTWDKESYLPIEYGGNAKFKSYLKENNLESLSTESRYKNSLVLEYSSNLMKEILEKTGTNLKSAEKKETSSKTRPRFSDDPNNIKTQENEYEKPISVYNSSSITSSFSNIKSFVGDSVKVISEKTKEYGSVIGSKVKSISKTLYEKGTNLTKKENKDKGESYNKPVVKRMTSYKKADWS